MAHLHLQHVSFSYGAFAVINNFSGDFHPGWTGIAGPNGAGKTTLLKVAAGILDPAAGAVSGPGERVYLPQLPDTDLPRLEEFFYDWEGRALEIKDTLGIQYDWLFRLSSLSSGELKRVQTGWALWNEPKILLADEPTNHLDEPTRNLILRSFEDYDGIGILVSHDRDLLDRLCSRCLYIEEGGITSCRGGYTAMCAARKQERERQVKEKERIRQEAAHLRKEAAKHRDLASRAHRIRSKRGVSRKDHDARFKINMARITGKDKNHGTILARFSGRIDRLEQEMSDIQVTKDRSLYFAFRGIPAPGRSLLLLPPDDIILDREEERYLRCPEIDIKNDDRILLTGANGSGKSTLLARILRAAGGTRTLYLPQELSETDTEALRGRFDLLDSEGRGFIGSVMDRLGSSPERILASRSWSPGEMRKMLFALGLLEEPEFIILDEPMNHLDLPSIECFQEALASVPVALLLVTHDEAFIDSWEYIRWHIKGEKLRI